MAIKCYHCKGNHDSVEIVKSCATVQKHLANTVAQNAKVDAVFAAKVEVGTLVETVIPAKVTVTKTVPAHRAIKKTMFTKPMDAGDAFLANMAKLQQVADADPTISIAEGIAKAQQIPAVKKGQDLDLGMYQIVKDGQATIYKIKLNKAGVHKYAEQLVITQKHVWDNETSTWKWVPKGKFVYMHGMVNMLTSENKMDEAAAKAFHDATKAKYGVDYGFCCVCGKLLTVKKSIAAGIGPVCQSKL